MSTLIQKLLIVSVVVGVGLFLGFRSAVHSRAPASLPLNNKSSLFKPEGLRISKPNQSIEVKIHEIGDFPASNDQEIHLQAEITLQKALDGDLSFEWKTPEGAVVVSGGHSQIVRNLRAGQILTEEITLLGFSSEGLPRNVIVDVGGLINGHPVGSTGVYPSHPTRRDLTIGFRKTKSLNFDTQMKVQSADDEVLSEEPQIPKGVHL